MSESADTSNVTDGKRVKLSILERMYNSSNHRIIQKLSGDHPAAEGGNVHAWLFPFVDIIYVGTVGNVSRFVDRCGGRDLNGGLFLSSLAILVIMFYTRAAFDSYVCISNAGGLIHVAVFCLYASAVFMMSVNIAEERARHGEAHLAFGACVAEPAYLQAFACAFAVSRVVLLIMYLLYLHVFHESNITGTFEKEIEIEELTRNTLTEAVKRTSAKRSPSSIHSDDPATIERMDKYLRSVRHDLVTRHFSRIYRYKIVPLAVSAIVMLALVYSTPDPQPGIIFPTVAALEILGDFIPSFFIKDKDASKDTENDKEKDANQHETDEEWKHFVTHRHFAQERLGLFFLLVMGEAVLGFHSVFYSSFHQSSSSYCVVILSYFIVFTMGLQFFEPFQRDPRPDGRHPLDLKILNPIYTFTVCCTCFFMLIASNGLVSIYKHMNLPSCADHCEYSLCWSKHDEKYKECLHLCKEGCHVVEESSDEPFNLEHAYGKVAFGLILTVLGALLLRFLDKAYYREQCLPKGLFEALERIYGNPISEPIAANDKTSCAFGWILSLSTLRFVCFLAMGILVIPDLLNAWSFVFGVCVLVMVPIWLEVSLQVYRNLATFVGERVVTVERAKSIKVPALEIKGPALVLQSVHSPAHPDIEVNL